MRLNAALAALPLLAALFAGCAGEEGTLSAVFSFTAKDAGKSSFAFDASGSTGKGLTYKWDFGDGATAEGEKVDHTYQYVNGDYAVKLTVTDSTGASAEIELPVTTGTQPNQEPVLCLTVDRRLAKPNEEFLFDATFSSDGDGEPLVYDWDFNAHDPVSVAQENEDLGHMQYGHAEQCPMIGPDAGGDGGGGHAGHCADCDLPALEDVQDVVDGLLPTEDAGHGAEGPHEEYNGELHAHLSGAEPIQVFKFPAAATYYVVVSARDPKGATSTGFIRIMVDEDAAAPVQTKTHEATLHYGTEELPSVPDAPVNKTDAWKWPMGFPGQIGATIQFSADNQEPELKVWLCTADKTEAECKAGPTKDVPKGKNPITFAHEFKAAKPGSYQILVENVSPTVNVMVKETLTQVFDTNPWYETESGLGGHAGH